MASIKINKNFSNLGVEIGQEALRIVHEEAISASVRAEADAKANAPHSTGLSRAAISRRSVKNLRGSTYSLIASSGYAAYLEFGTRPYLNIPAGLESYAREFIGSKAGNTKAKPHIIPAMYKSSDEFVEKIKERLTKLQ